MRPDSPRWVEVTPSEYSHERAGLTVVRDLLPDAEPYRAWSNFTFTTPDGRLYEVDLLVVGRSGLHLVELKHWSGTITGDAQTWWHISNPVDNPRLLADVKAKRLASLLKDMAREQNIRVRVPFVTASVLLHAPDADVRLHDRAKAGVYGLDDQGPKGLPGIVGELLTAAPRDERDVIDPRRSKELAKLVKASGIRRSTRHRKVGTLLVDEELLAEGQGWQDYLARHTQLEGVVRRVRFYLVARAASAEQRATIERAARREFALLEGINHPGIARAVDFVDHERGPAVIFEHDPTEVRLDHFLAQHCDDLSLDARIELVRTLANTVRYAHGRRLVHRRLSPRSIAVRELGKGRYGVRIRDWQTAGRLLGSTTQGTYVSGTRHLDALTDPGAGPYLAPEGHRDPNADPILLDVFSLGAVSYQIFTGDPPASGPDDLLARLGAEGGLDLTAVIDGAPQSLRDLIYEATYGDTDLRTNSASDFLRGLDATLEEITRPEPAEQVDPLDAQSEDLIGPIEQPTRFRVLQRLGRGSTAQALLVEDTTKEDGNRAVLKVALDEQRARRLRDEAEVLAAVRDARVARTLEPPLTIGGRTALVLEDAGRESVAALIHEQGRLSIDLLERWGRDLLEIVQQLDLVGVNHRDLKPENLAFREMGSRRQRHLTLFDFSLSRAPLEETKAGTVPYLDPFFDPVRRSRWDAAAERYAAAVTLFEMATGTLPIYGDGHAHPALVTDDVVVAPEMFDPAIADGLVVFFRTALARDPARRHDTLSDMLADWTRVFTAVPAAAADETAEPVPGDERDDLAGRAGPDTALEASGLTPRAVSALTRLGVATVGDLVARPPLEVSRTPGVSEATRREIRRRAKQWRNRLAPSRSVEQTTAVGGQELDTGAATSVDAVLVALLPRATARNQTEVRAIRLLLGLPDTSGGAALFWPSQSEVAERLGVTAPRVNQIAIRARASWLRTAALTAVREQVVDLLDDAGGVMSAEDLARALLATRGSSADDADRLARGLGLVRAAVETELDRGGEARMELRRVHGGVLVGREPDDPEVPPAAMLLDYATALGRLADQLAAEDPLPSPGRALERLRAVPLPDGVTALSDTRLLRVAVAASRAAAVTARADVYPVGLSAERALRALSSALSALPQGFDEDELRRRVRSRFPQAAPLPRWPELAQVLQSVGVRVEYRQGRYQPVRPASTGLASTQTRTRIGTGAAGRDEAVEREIADLDDRLRDSLASHGFLSLTCRGSRLDEAAAVLTERFGVRPYDVTAALLDEMHRLADAHNVDWSLVLRSDRPDAPPRDAANLRQLLARALPAVETRVIEAAEPLLLLNAEPLARYDRLDWLEEVADRATRKPAARWLLVPAAREGGTPMLDRQPAPTIGGWHHLPTSWVDHRNQSTGRAS